MTKPLDVLGRFLVNRVRDESIWQWKRIASGSMPGDENDAKTLASLGTEGKEAFLQLVPSVVDTVLHHLLWSLEQDEEVHLMVRQKEGQYVDAAQVSDGLPGELYSDEGWIARFSKD